MSSTRMFGLEKRDGHEIGRDPRGVPREDLHRAGHKPLSPMKALRLKCLDCCNGSALEVRLCTAVACPIWPFRMGRNPWRKPMSEEQRARRAEQMRCNHAAALIGPDKTLGKIDNSIHEGVQVPDTAPANSSLKILGDQSGGSA